MSNTTKYKIKKNVKLTKVFKKIMGNVLYGVYDVITEYNGGYSQDIMGSGKVCLGSDSVLIRLTNGKEFIVRSTEYTFFTLMDKTCSIIDVEGYEY